MFFLLSPLGTRESIILLHEPRKENISTRLFRNPAITCGLRGWLGGTKGKAKAFSNRARLRRILFQPSARPGTQRPARLCACLSSFISYNFLNSPRWMWKPVFLLNLSLRLLLLTFFTSSSGSLVCVKKLEEHNERRRRRRFFKNVHVM